MTPTGCASVGRRYFLPARARERARYGWNTNSNDDSTLVTASCWAVSLIAYLCDGPPDLVVPLVSLGALTGVAEWMMSDQEQ
jgi:hypothetical protein